MARGAASETAVVLTVDRGEEQFDRYTPTESVTQQKERKPRKKVAGRRVAPENAVMAARDEKERKSSSRNTKLLRVDTSSTSDPPGKNTPGSRRGQSDYRSPGQRKSTQAKDGAPTPDFITQTDRYGNASTPRSEGAITKARVVNPSGPKPHLHVTKDGSLAENEPHSEIDACAETLLDSIRLMCCCLSPEEGNVIKSQDTDEAASDDGIPKLLPMIHPGDKGKKCLVLDLDETLVHSSFRAVPGADFVIPVQIEDVVHFVYVAKRPGVDEFLVEMAKYYEVVIYTASLNKYADPLLDLLDPHQTIRARLFRESCVYYEGNYVKDLSLLDRDLTQTIIIDNSPNSYLFHPENAIDCSSFIDDPKDRELDQIGAFLKGIRDVEDVRSVCHKWREWPRS